MTTTDRVRARVVSQLARRGPRPGKAQRREHARQGGNHTLYVFDQDWSLIEALSTELSWTYGRVHGTLLRFLLTRNRRTVTKLAADLQAFDQRTAGARRRSASPDHG